MAVQASAKRKVVDHGGRDGCTGDACLLSDVGLSEKALPGYIGLLKYTQQGLADIKRRPLIKRPVAGKKHGFYNRTTQYGPAFRVLQTRGWREHGQKARK
jgi:hypothetical protein